MRSDMAKVIVERPRVGGGKATDSRFSQNQKNALRNAIVDPEHHDEPGNVESVKFRHVRSYSSKSLNENLYLTASNLAILDAEQARLSDLVGFRVSQAATMRAILVGYRPPTHKG